MAIGFIEPLDQYGGDESAAVSRAGYIAFNSNLSEANPAIGDWHVRHGIIGGSVIMSLGGPKTTIIFGARFAMSSLPIRQRGSYRIFAAQNTDVDTHIQVSIGTTGRIRVYRGSAGGAGDSGVLIAESTLEVSPGTYNHYEIKVVGGASDDGSVSVKVNGRTFINETNITTYSATPNTFDRIQFGTHSTLLNDFGGSGQVEDWDSWYWIDGDSTGGLEDDMIGLYDCYWLPVDADGVNADWNLTTGTDGFALLNEVPPDEDVSYIFTNVVDDESSFETVNLPAGIVDIKALTPIARSRKTDGGDGDIQVGVVSGASTDYAGDYALTEQYTYLGPVYEFDPDDDAVWTADNLPEVAVKRSL